MDELQCFGKRLKELMQKENISYVKLGERICVDRETLRGWANAKHYPNGYYLMKLSRYFNVTVDYLLFGDKNE